MRGSALRIRAEDQLRRDADHQKGFSFKGDGHARLHELRQADLAAVLLRQKHGALRIQQPERLHQSGKHLLNLIQKSLLGYHVLILLSRTPFRQSQIRNYYNA